MSLRSYRRLAVTLLLMIFASSCARRTTAVAPNTFDPCRDLYTEVLKIQNTGALADDVVLGFARCARTTGRIGSAISVLEDFLKESPSASSWNQLGLLYDETGDLAAGEKALRKAAALKADPTVHNNLGYNLFLQDKPEAAEAEFRRALEFDAAFATARNNLGAVLARRGDLDGALEQFQMTADPATAHNNLAVVLFEAGKYEQSRQQLIKALAIRPDFAPALANFKIVQEVIDKKGF